MTDKTKDDKEASYIDDGGVKRRHDGVWAKGGSGNPQGKNEAYREASRKLKSLLVDDLPDIHRTMKYILNNGTERGQISIMDTMLDRLMGRPNQTLELEIKEDTDPKNMSREKLAALYYIKNKPAIDKVIELGLEEEEKEIKDVVVKDGKKGKDKE